MKRYLITYRESRDSETQTCTFRGYDAGHAEERFVDSCAEEGGMQGLVIVSVTLIRPDKAIKALYA
jgi:hypothetical protein